MTRLHWPPHGRTLCGREGLGRAESAVSVSCRMCRAAHSPKPVCPAISPKGHKCSGPEGHQGLHYCRGVSRWRGNYPERCLAPASVPQLTSAALKEWREGLGLSLIAAERRLGTDRGGQMWGRWERGRVPLLLSYIARWLPELPEE